MASWREVSKMAELTGDLNLEGLPIEKLREMRIDILRLEEAESRKADKARLEAGMYARAVANLTDQAAKTEAEAKEHEAKGETEAAEELRKSIVEMKALIEKNSRLTDAKTFEAMNHENKAVHYKERSIKIGARLRESYNQWDHLLF
jgi:hypothetical protein